MLMFHSAVCRFRLLKAFLVSTNSTESVLSCVTVEHMARIAASLPASWPAPVEVHLWSHG